MEATESMFPAGFSENPRSGVENKEEAEGRPRPRYVTHFTLQSPFNSRIKKLGEVCPQALLGRA